MWFSSGGSMISQKIKTIGQGCVSRMLHFYVVVNHCAENCAVMVFQVYFLELDRLAHRKEHNYVS